MPSPCIVKVIILCPTFVFVWLYRYQVFTCLSKTTKTAKYFSATDNSLREINIALYIN